MRTILIALCLALAGCAGPDSPTVRPGLIVATPSNLSGSEPSLSGTADDTWLCTRVIDGDTIVVEHGGVSERVRLLDVDAPETGQPGANEATEALRARLEGKRVRLSRKTYSTGKQSPDRDRYKRLLRLVEVAE